MPNDLKITYLGSTGFTFTDILPYNGEALAVPMDINWTGGPITPGSSYLKTLVSVNQITAVSLLSTPTRLQLTFDDGRGSKTATYGPDAHLFVQRLNKPSRNPELRATLSIYCSPTGGGWGEHDTNGGDYWVSVKTLQTATLQAAPTVWPG